MSTSTPAPETIGGLSLAWITQLAAALRHEGLAFRASPDGPWIEVQNMHTGAWETLTLEGRKMGDCIFASAAARDAALAAIEARVSPSFFSPAERARATAILNTLGDASRH